MNGLFSLPLYLQGLRRVRVVGIAMAVIYTVLNSLLAILVKEPMSHCTTCCGVCGANGVHSAEFARYVFLVPLVAVVISYAMFSWLTSRRSSDYYHSLPQKRTTVFVSQTLAALTWCLGIILLSFAVEGVLWGVLHGRSVPFIVYVNSIVWGFTAALLFSACTVLGVCLAGTKASAVLAALSALLSPTLIVAWVVKVLDIAYPYFIKERTILPYLGGGRYMLGKFLYIWDFKSYDYEANELAQGELSALLSEQVFALALLGLAYLAFVKRKSEIASSSSLQGGLYHKIARTALAFPFAMVAAYHLFWGEGVATGMLWLLGSLLAFCVYQFVASKSLKSLIKALPWFATVIAACGIVAGSVGLSIAIMKGNDPDDVSEIESVVITGYMFSAFDFLKDTEIKDEEGIKAVLQSYPPVDSERTLTTLVINYKNGKTVYRKYKYSEKALEQYVISTPALSKQLYPLPKGVELDGDKDKELWDSFNQEYYKLGIEDRRRATAKYQNADQYKSFSVKVIEGDKLREKTYYVYASAMPKTYKLITEGGYDA